jgi:hypothetical protein
MDQANLPLKTFHPENDSTPISPEPSLTVLRNHPVKGFTIPTLDEVSAYMSERGITDREKQAELFIAHHAARGWKYKSGIAMKDWRSAVITWQGNIGKFGGNGNGQRQSFQEAAKQRSSSALSEVDAGIDKILQKVDGGLSEPSDHERANRNLFGNSG